jgi:hypothetical protein
MVLASMGRMYLDKGDLLLAREALERSLKQLGRGMQPAYQNAVASLAATYSGLAKQYLRDAYDGQAKPSADSLKLHPSTSPRPQTGTQSLLPSQGWPP